MEDNFNAAEPQEQTEVHSDAQDRVVDDPQSQTGGSAVALDGQGDVVDPREEEGEDAEGETDDDRQAETGGQTRQENAAIRAARLRAKREAEAEADKRVGERLAKSGLVNPYTHKPFTSLQEVEEYGERVRQAQIKKLAKESGRSEEEVSAEMADKDFLRRMRQEADGKDAERKAKEERDAFILADAVDFVTRYPDVDVDKLEQNESFREFCGSRFGKEPLGDLYASFLKVTGAAGQAAVARQKGRSDRSTGGGSIGGMAMTPDQQRALDAWNAANPDMAMTAKEYLARAGK